MKTDTFLYLTWLKLFLQTITKSLYAFFRSVRGNLGVLHLPRNLWRGRLQELGTDHRRGDGHARLGLRLDGHVGGHASRTHTHTHTCIHPWIKCLLIIFTITYAKYREAQTDLQRIYNIEFYLLVCLSFTFSPQEGVYLKVSSIPWVPRVPTADMWFHQKFTLNSRNFSSNDFLLSSSLFKVDEISSEKGIGLILSTEWFYSPHNVTESSVKIIRFVRVDQSISWGQE